MRDLQKPKLSPDPGSTLLPGVVYFVFQTKEVVINVRSIVELLILFPFFGGCLISKRNKSNNKP